MSDEGKAGIVLLLWSVAFNAGMLIAGELNRAVGLMLMASATVIAAVYLRGEARADAEKRRRKRYEADCAKRIEEAMRHDP